jgi:5-methylcytosine-specific restriction endonuclease McrA
VTDRGPNWTARAKRIAGQASTCAICGRELLHGAPPRSRWSPSVDHILPAALGGSHDSANLRAVHYGCNARRGARQPKPGRRLVRALPEAWL